MPKIKKSKKKKKTPSTNLAKEADEWEKIKEKLKSKTGEKE